LPIAIIVMAIVFGGIVAASLPPGRALAAFRDDDALCSGP
jgi:hypothetical protein